MNKRKLMIIATFVLTITSVFSQVASEVFERPSSSNTGVLVILIAAGIIVGAVILIRKRIKAWKERKELIRKLTPNHFLHGENFDRVVFVSLVVALQKQANKAWTFIIMPLSLGVAAVLQFVVGGFFGNMMSLVVIFLGILLMILLTGKTNSQVKSAIKTLGINKKDIKVAIQAAKEGILKNK